MHPMETDRRQFLAGLLALMPGLGSPGRALADVREIVAGAIRRPDGSYAAVLYDVDRGLIGEASLPGRGHDVAINPVTGDCVAFARRPGNFAVAFGPRNRRQPVAFTTPATHHFYGHGVFTRDGRLLYTTENTLETGQGAIGVWDVAGGYRRVGVIPSHGIGPHDLDLLHDGTTLVVANGGIATHPDNGRVQLNLATMEPSLAYLDTRTGSLRELHRLPPSLHQNSIRHLTIATNDTVVFGCQFKGPRTEVVDLIGMHRMGGELALVSGDLETHRALRHYVSSITADRAGETVAVSSSRGQGVVFVDVAKRAVVGTRSFPDVSGIAADNKAGGFIATGGGGDVGRLNPELHGAKRLAPAAWSWDNHLVQWSASEA